MKSIIEKFQKNMAAAAFAEAGEWETARQMTPAYELPRKVNWLNTIFTAVTFAEAGLHSEALNYLEAKGNARAGSTQPLMDDLGLKGVRLLYGTVSI